MYAERIVDAGLFLERKGAICKKENVCKQAKTQCLL